MSAFHFISADVPLHDYESAFDGPPAERVSLNEIKQRRLDMPIWLGIYEENFDHDIKLFYYEHEDSRNRLLIGASVNADNSGLLLSDKKFHIGFRPGQTEKRDLELIRYVENILIHTDEVEIWSVFLEVRREEVIIRHRCRIDELTTKRIEEVCTNPSWERYYCLTIHK